MNDHSSIKYISSLLNAPDRISVSDKGSIDLFRQTYPYFVPVRYLVAAERNKAASFAPAMLSEMQPYVGNWLLFCDLIEGRLKPLERKATPARTPVPDEPQPIVAEVIVTQEEEVIEVVTPDEQSEKPVISDIFIEEITEAVVLEDEIPAAANEEIAEPLIASVYTQDYFLQQGEKVSEEIPVEIDELIEKEPVEDEDKSLMVMMSFSEWLLHFKNAAQKKEEEQKDQRALRTMWQKEKLAAAMEEENEEIPENVFEMAVNSITKEEDLASESLANIYVKQGKYEQAAEMFRKLSLRDPQKSAYFARKIEEILKERS